MVYLTTLSIYQITQSRVIGCLMNNRSQKTCKWYSWHSLRFYPGNCLLGLRKTTKIINWDSRFSGRDLSPGHLEYKVLPTVKLLRNVKRIKSVLHEKLSVRCDEAEAFPHSSADHSIYLSQPSLKPLTSTANILFILASAGFSRTARRLNPQVVLYRLRYF